MAGTFYLVLAIVFWIPLFLCGSLHCPQIYVNIGCFKENIMNFDTILL